MEDLGYGKWVKILCRNERRFLKLLNVDGGEIFKVFLEANGDIASEIDYESCCYGLKAGILMAADDGGWDEGI